jgi:hypothetical protein
MLVLARYAEDCREDALALVRIARDFPHAGMKHDPKTNYTG